jgi:O-antigen/teichoic acid export membrane protein
LAVVIVTRALGPTGQGIVALALVLPATLVLMLNAGLDIANMHFAGGGRAETTELAENSVLISLFGGVVATVVVVVLAMSGVSSRLLPHLDAILLAMGAILVPLNLLDMTLAGLQRGKHRLVTANALDIAQSLITVLLLVFLVTVLHLGATTAVVAYIVATFISAVGRAIAVRFGLGASLLPRWRGAVLKRTLLFGLKSSAGNLLQFLAYRLDVFFLNFVAGAAVVGQYAVAFRLAELVWLFPHAVGLVLLPRAASLATDARDDVAPRTFWMTFMVSGAAGLVIAALGRPVITMVFSDAFADAYRPMVLLLPGICLLGPASVLANDVAGRGYPGRNAMVAAAVAGLTVVLDALLIPRFALGGAAVASTVAYAVSSGGSMYAYLRTSSMSLREFLACAAWWSAPAAARAP